ncbi:response regulator transcription factor [Cohnella silvisoli]|uniref:Response regulator transcription factor n=1 Tax=Cohnella silvisoli TaxID=2873699 RepID=A0ABV1L049_9BACL|nr:response regulator transcription factor [Cohnella silvisoli]
MIRIVIADDQRLMRDGLQTMIQLTEGMEVVGLAENGRRAIELVKEHQPNLVLMDIQMPDLDGIAATKHIRQHYSQTRILILTTYAEDDYIIEALVSGASGFLLKDLPGETIISSIRDTMDGTLLMPNAVAARLASRLNFLSATTPLAPAHSDFNGKDDFEHFNFTDREKKIIELMVVGKGNREIANDLFISEGTMRNYISTIYNKIGVNDRLKAITLLREWLNQGR